MEGFAGKKKWNDNHEMTIADIFLINKSSDLLLRNGSLLLGPDGLSLIVSWL